MILRNLPVQQPSTYLSLEISGPLPSSNNRRQECFGHTKRYESLPHLAAQESEKDTTCVSVNDCVVICVFI